MSILCFITLGLACTAAGQAGVFGERELRPPTGGVQVGWLYYVREAPTNDLSKPANLILLCSTNLAKYNIAPRTYPVGDIDLMSRLEAEGSLNRLQTSFVQAGLSGSLNYHYSYSLTNVKRTEVSFAEAEQVYSQRGFQTDCLNYRGNIEKNNWGIYQVQTISVGDIKFERKTDGSFSGDAQVKLAKFEPQVKAAIKAAVGSGLSGKGLVATFTPILRSEVRR